MTASPLLRRAARLLRRGGVVAYPTEAVFGLGCDPGDEAALRRILAIKGRPGRAGYILIAANRGQLQGWIAPTAAEQRRLAAPTRSPYAADSAGDSTWWSPGRPAGSRARPRSGSRRPARSCAAADPPGRLAGAGVTPPAGIL